LFSDEGAHWDDVINIAAEDVAPTITWGTSPEQAAPITASAPVPSQIADRVKRDAAERALAYMGLEPGQKLEGLKIDRVFIGSCTNSRLSDLQLAAALVRGHHVSPHVRALVVPGSMSVKREAEALGLDVIFREAGFEWRDAGCSMCVSINEDVVPPGSRCIATTNRNFENRQGPKSRTHIASPAVVAAAALAGCIPDTSMMKVNVEGLS
jgi:3-isopropylmalate/(R)-2-methylmalate dehydratase large subunit